jgi:hypothetical protein
MIPKPITSIRIVIKINVNALLFGFSDIVVNKKFF